MPTLVAMRASSMTCVPWPLWFGVCGAMRIE